MATRELTDEQAGEIAALLQDIEIAARAIRDDWSDPRADLRDIHACLNALRRLLGFPA